MLIAEDLLLLLTDDESGRFVVEGTSLDLALAGACLIELAHLGRVDVAGDGEAFKPGRLVVRDPAPTGDPVLDDSLGRLVERQGKKPVQVLSALQKGLRMALLDRLAAAGVVRRESERVLGVFPVTRWPGVDSRHEVTVRAELEQVLLHDVPPDPRTAALVGLLSATGSAPKVVGAEDRAAKRAVKERAKAIAEQEWAADAVGKAIQAVQAAILGAVVAASVAASAGSTGG